MLWLVLGKRLIQPYKNQKSVSKFGREKYLQSSSWIHWAYLYLIEDRQFLNFPSLHPDGDMGHFVIIYILQDIWTNPQNSSIGEGISQNSLYLREAFLQRHFLLIILRSSAEENVLFILTQDNVSLMQKEKKGFDTTSLSL